MFLRHLHKIAQNWEAYDEHVRGATRIWRYLVGRAAGGVWPRELDGETRLVR
jgi:hypothetical protein